MQRMVYGVDTINTQPLLIKMHINDKILKANNLTVRIMTERNQPELKKSTNDMKNIPKLRVFCFV